MKEFGLKTTNRVQREPEQFTLHYLDADEERRRFVGTVVPRASGGDIAGMMSAMRSDDPTVLSRAVALLTKVMSNKDGLVPAKWQPTMLKQEEGDDRPVSFRGPDGEIYAMSDTEALARFADHGNWTTRRRWKHLIEDDDEAVIEAEDLSELLQWVVSLSTDRPTAPRS